MRWRTKEAQVGENLRGQEREVEGSIWEEKINRYLLSWWCVVSLLVISAGDKFCARDLLLILSRFLLVVQLRLREKRRLEKAGSSFPLKKTINVLPKIQLSDESDIIVGDCEVGSTRKACKNCTCGRAKAEEKVEKLTLTAEQITNPQSACGNFVVGLGDKVSPTDIEEGMPVGLKRCWAGELN
ncbi:Anamorsin [Carex littledalei]|uniref:Anamorsin n=1 Tax=Carex littledalei TaxID=544730 RepID=A0A833QZJ8_9POAL|nr:Anamorsin [Carex littledalei]